MQDPKTVMFRDTSVTDHDPTLPTSAPHRPRLAESALAPEPLVVICFVCRAFRDDGGGWAPAHATLHGDARRELTHGLCPSCLERLYPEAPAGEAAVG